MFIKIPYYMNLYFLFCVPYGWGWMPNLTYSVYHPQELYPGRRHVVVFLSTVSLIMQWINTVGHGLFIFISAGPREWDNFIVRFE